MLAESTAPGRTPRHKASALVQMAVSAGSGVLAIYHAIHCQPAESGHHAGVSIVTAITGLHTWWVHRSGK
jgi:hypothetical protein